MESVISVPAVDLAPLLAQVQGTLFALVRIGAFLVAAPAFGARFVPLPIRIVCSVVLSLPVVEHSTLPGMAEMASLRIVPILLGEIALGVTAGLVLQILFAAAGVAGDRIANAAGLGFAAQLDPTGAGHNPVIAQAFGMSQLYVFFSTDMHLAVIRLLLTSYSTFPPGAVPRIPVLVEAGLAAGGAMFLLSVGLMLPAVAGLIMLNLAVGVLARSAPQLNLFSVGFPLALIAALLLLWMTAPSMAETMMRIANEGVARLQDLLRG